MFTFVFANAPSEARGWWLMISDMDNLAEYIEKTHGNPRMAEALNIYTRLHTKGQESYPKKSVREVIADMPAEERIKLTTDSSSAWNIMYAALMQAENIGGTILDGFRCLNMDYGVAYIRNIREDGVCFINQNGGCNSIIEYNDWCRKNDLVWPDFTKDDIRVKQFPGGDHWYAYIGSMEVHNGDTLRFWSKDDAWNAAVSIIENA